MIPLLVTATTPHGLVLSRPWGVPLDALLASVLWDRRKWAARAAGEHFVYQPEQPPEDLDLPLARCGDGPDWHWMATFADLHPAGLDPDIRWIMTATDRQRVNDLCASTGNVINDRSGRYQRRTIPVMAHPAASVSWRAVGDPDRIRELMTSVRRIGKRRNVGEGVVTRWEITETPDVNEWEAGHLHEPGVLGRAVPVRCLQDAPSIQTGPVGMATIRPPYLNPETRMESGSPAR